MSKKFSNLSLQTKASFAYTVANLISKGVSIITVPIFTRILTTAEIGVGTTYSSWYSILYAIITLSLCSGSLNIAMMEYKDRRDQYESACLTLSTISGVIFLFLYLILQDKICKITTLDKGVMLLLVLSMIINPALDFWYARQRYEFKYKSSVAVSIGITISSAVISIICVLVSKSHLDINLGNIKVLSQGMVLLLISSFAYIYIFRKGRVFFDKEIWKYALALSLPLIIHSLSKSVLDLSDRLMIASMCGQSYAGIYGTVYSLSMLSLIIWNAINTSLIPTTFEALKVGNTDTINKVIQYILVIFGGVSIGVTLLAPEILKIFTTSEYWGAMYLVPALSAGIYFTALYNIYGNFLLYKKKTIHIMLGTSIAALTNIVLNYIFIKLYGYIAAAYTTLASFIVLALMQSIMCRIIYKKSIIEDKKIFTLSLIVVIFCLACNSLYSFPLARYFLVVLIIIAGIIKRKEILSFFTKS